jgi:hypothetical protein
MKDFSLDKAINQMLGESRWGQRYMAISIENDWETIMGSTIAKYTKLRIQQKKLFVSTDVAPLKNELSLNKKGIIEKINAFYKKEIITEVVIN